MIYTWKRYGGYECSSKGDRRFSAFNARLPDGRTIEQHYQCDVKGYDPGGTDWRLGKGKPPLKDMTADQLWHAYLDLWIQWAENNGELIDELRRLASKHGGILSDMFAKTGINQAAALAVVCNNREPST
jgi:hypothetical protein